MEPPVDHLDLRAKATDLPGGKDCIRLPVIARPDPKAPAGNIRMYYINRFADKGEELAIGLSVVSRDPHIPAAEVKDAFLANLQKSANLPSLPSAARLTDRADAWVTDFIPLRVEAPEEPQATRLVRYSFWAPRPDQMVLCQFILNPAAAGAKDTYAAAMDKMLATLKAKGGGPATAP
jgi:hypothetical protein